MKTICHHNHCAACQVTLTVIYPEAFIHGGEEYHVDAGSPVALACVIGDDGGEDDDDDGGDDDDDGGYDDDDGGYDEVHNRKCPFVITQRTLYARASFV